MPYRGWRGKEALSVGSTDMLRHVARIFTVVVLYLVPQTAASYAVAGMWATGVFLNR